MANNNSDDPRLKPEARQAAPQSADAPGDNAANAKQKPTLKQRTREIADDFTFSTLLTGVSAEKEAVVNVPQPSVEPKRPSKAPIIAACTVVALLIIAGAWKLLGRSSSEAAPPSGPATSTPSSAAPTLTAGLVRFRLPADQGAADSSVQAPVYILSDFELGPGNWRPDKRLPACGNAAVARVRNGAAQGNYWLKLDHINLIPNTASDAALIIRPDSPDLSHHGTTVSAALYLPENAPDGMKAELGVEDSRGQLHSQGDGATLRPGKWTLVQWSAGDLLQDVAQLDVILHGAGRSYTGFLGLDNVQLHQEGAPPVLSEVAATVEPDGTVRVGDKEHVETELGVAVCGPNGETARETTDTANMKHDADHVVTVGALSVPGDPNAAISVRTAVHPEYNRTLDVDVDVAAKKSARLRTLAAEVLLPKSLFGNAYVDLPSAKSSPSPAPPTLLAATAEEVHVAGDYPSGLAVKADKPATFIVREDAVPTTFTYTSDRPLQSVHVAGAFNHWNTTATPMRLTSGNAWQVTVPLSPGEQQYKFVLNGSEWITDPQSAKDVKDAQGNMNSVRFVPRGPGMGDGFRLWLVMAGSPDGDPVTLEAGKTLHRSFRVTFNQPFKNALNR